MIIELRPAASAVNAHDLYCVLKESDFADKYVGGLFANTEKKIATFYGDDSEEQGKEYVDYVRELCGDD